MRSRGVCEPALEPRCEGEGSRTRCQDFKPDLGNSAVRHYRGAFENVAMVEMRTQLAIERAGLVTLHLQPARRSSIPTKTPVTKSMSANADWRQAQPDVIAVTARTFLGKLILLMATTVFIPRNTKTSVAFIS